MDGEDGKSVTTGTTDPADADGADGDTYVNLTTGVVFVKVGGTWTPLPGSLRGLLGGGSRYSSGSISLGVGVASNASVPVTFNNVGPQ
ncbi:MAG TPA: hypothetical protein PLV68_10860, partial [Ilumatobacteraceae bacterium]|nr:hypothetical protein [Ilumatobacteraceae bacterium]